MGMTDRRSRINIETTPLLSTHLSLSEWEMWSFGCTHLYAAKKYVCVVNIYKKYEKIAKKKEPTFN